MWYGKFSMSCNNSNLPLESKFSLVFNYFFAGVDGLSMFGLSHDHIRYLTEQLPGAHKCRVYNFKYHHYDEEFWKVWLIGYID